MVIGLLALYLIVALVFPLAMVFSKALQEYRFVPSQIEIAFQQNGVYGDARTLQSWIDETGYVVNDGLRASERTRLQIVRVIPKPARADVDGYRVTDLSKSGGQILYNGVFSEAGEVFEIEARDLGRIQIRPQMHYGFDNFSYYFGQKSLSNSITNSLVIALIVVVINVPLAFGFAYGLTRTRIRFKEGFKLISTVPILVPSLLPAIGLVYLFGNQGILTPLLLGNSIYGPIGIVMASVFSPFPMP